MSKYFHQAAGFVPVPQKESEADIEAFVPAKTRSRWWTGRLWPLLCLLVGLTVGGYLGRYVDRAWDLDHVCISHISEHCKSPLSTLA